MFNVYTKYVQYLAIFVEYLHNTWPTFALYVCNICTMFKQYLHNICRLFEQYLHYIYILLIYVGQVLCKYSTNIAEYCTYFV